MTSKPRAAQWMVVVSLLVLVLGACGDQGTTGDAEATTTPESTLTAEQILNQASDRLDATQSLHFNLEVEGRTFIDAANTIQILSAEGNLKRPDRVQASFVANLLGRANVTIRIITVGTTTWWTDLVSGAWGAAPPDIGYDASVLFDDTVGLAPILRAFSGAERAGTEEIDGVEAYRISGTVPRTLIDDVTAETLQGETVDVTVLIARATDDIRRVIVAESTDVPETDRASWTLNVSRYDEPVTIEPPV